MSNKTKILGWTIVGIVAAIVITTVVTALVPGGVSKAILISLWVGLIFGAGLGVLIKLWFDWKKEDHMNQVVSEKAKLYKVSEEGMDGNAVVEPMPKKKRKTQPKGKNENAN